jgi:hypothetical protein
MPVNNFGERFLKNVRRFQEFEKSTRGRCVPRPVQSKSAVDNRLPGSLRFDTATKPVFLFAQGMPDAVDTRVHRVGKPALPVKAGTLFENVIDAMQAVAQKEGHHTTSDAAACACEV